MDEILTQTELETLPADKAELMDRIRRARAALDEVVQPLSEAWLSKPGTQGGWAVKDHLGHIAAWEQFMLKHYLQDVPSHEAMGIEAEMLKGLNDDGINEILHERIKDMSAGQALAQYQRSHAQVLKMLEATSFEALMEPFSAGDPRARPRLLWVVGNTYQHYLEHRQWIKELLMGLSL